MSTSTPNKFLHSILDECETIEGKELASLLLKMAHEMTDLKLRVKEIIDETCVNFTELAQDHSQLLKKAKSLSVEIDTLSSKVTNETTYSLKDSTSELQELSTSMQEVSLMVSIVNNLLTFQITLQSISKFQENKEYGAIARALHSMFCMLSEQRDKSGDLEIHQALAKEYSAQNDIFMDEMLVLWRECIKFQSKIDESSQLEVNTLQIDILRSDELCQMFLALNYLEHVLLYFKKFADWILKSLLLPIMINSASATIVHTDKDALLSVQVKPNSQPYSYENVFENLLKVFHFINLFLGVNIEEDITLLNKLGTLIGQEFYNLLIEHCLSATIPDHSSELENYKSVIANTTDFQSELFEIGFLDKNDQPLLDYISNVEYLCANKTCRSLVEKARNIMRKDLYDVMEVGGVPNVTEEDAMPAEPENITSIKAEINLSKNTFQFPKCHISKSAMELLNLLNQIIVDCVGSTEMCSIRLFYTARNIVEMFSALMPTYHHKYLESIPQQVAVFHNNCMFLSHCLLTLGDKHHNHLPQALQMHLVTFIDQVTEIRHLGRSVFLKYMQTQRNQILDIIRNCGLATLRESSNLTAGTEKSLRQCMRQLELLQSVWQPVLPDNVYNKAIGCLVNAFVDELITRVVTVEDIPAETASQLVDMFKIVSSRMPKVFHEPKEIHWHVRKWEVFLELTLILGASLKDISERWANGKGPLAHLFQPEQVKQLIRALFQNTERRSAILLSIK